MVSDVGVIKCVNKTFILLDSGTLFSLSETMPQHVFNCIYIILPHILSMKFQSIKHQVDLGSLMTTNGNNLDIVMLTIWSVNKEISSTCWIGRLQFGQYGVPKELGPEMRHWNFPPHGTVVTSPWL